jgi:hypothetical protein
MAEVVHSYGRNQLLCRTKFFVFPNTTDDILYALQFFALKL